MAYPIPTERERAALFRFLRQQSSYTAWATMEPYFKAWVDCLKGIPPEAANGPDSKLDFYGDYLLGLQRCYAAFVDSLVKLKRGDRSVFKWLGYGTGQGFFCEALRAVGIWDTNISRVALEGPFPLLDSSFGGLFAARFQTFKSATGNGRFALEVRHTDVPAPLYDITPLNGTSAYTVRPFTPHPVFAALMAQDLPPVPRPPQEVIVKTGDDIPCYGIWEPVKLDLSPGFAGLFKKPVLPVDGEFEVDGCMNYLHAGSPAPTIAFEGDDIRREGRPTTWRLLWRDDRYTDGAIPDEEKEYVFHVQDYVAQLLSQPTVPTPDSGLLMASSGDTATRAGRWAVKDVLGGHVDVQQGDILPQHQGRDVQWVWSPN